LLNPAPTPLLVPNLDDPPRSHPLSVSDAEIIVRYVPTADPCSKDYFGFASVITPGSVSIARTGLCPRTVASVSE
jgi:hypothetical protein